MAEAKKKSKAILKGITPKGVAIFPWITKADTKWKPEGEFRIRLKLEGNDADTLRAQIDEAYDKAIALMAEEKEILPKKIKKVDKPYKLEEDKEGNETGAVLFTFKQKAQITLKDKTVKNIKVDVVDAKNKPLPKDTPVYGGSIVRVAFEALPFYAPASGAGLTLRLNAVKVLTLVSSGSRDHGFDEEEGYEAEESDDSTGSDKPAAKSKGDESDDNPDF